MVKADQNDQKRKLKLFQMLPSFCSRSYANVVPGREARVINTGYAYGNFVSVGLINVRNDCFFNSTVQALFSLSSFRDHVENFDSSVFKNFDSSVSNKVNAVASIQQLFRNMAAKIRDLLDTHNFLNH